MSGLWRPRIQKHGSDHLWQSVVLRGFNEMRERCLRLGGPLCLVVLLPPPPPGSQWPSGVGTDLYVPTINQCVTLLRI